MSEIFRWDAPMTDDSFSAALKETADSTDWNGPLQCDGFHIGARWARQWSLNNITMLSDVLYARDKTITKQAELIEELVSALECNNKVTMWDKRNQALAKATKLNNSQP